MNTTRRANQLHIGIFGKTNSGKSTLINALTGQHTAKVSSEAGTTTDPVYKAIEIYGVGACVLIDTAGFDDGSYQDQMRVEKMRLAMERTDVALIVCSEEDITQELEWAKEFKARKAPVIMIINKIDQISNTDKMRSRIYETLKEEPIKISAISMIGIEKIREEIINNIPEDFETRNVTGDLVKPGDTVLLVFTQEIPAPKGRLILPQVQTLRELLDRKCIVLSCTLDLMEQTLAALVKPPVLIISDSQVMKQVYEKKPAESLLTSFSILLASHKGDIDYYIQSAETIGQLTRYSKVMIADACAHVPQTEDIGREKLPEFLRERFGDNIAIVNVSGNDFPIDLTGYDIIIQCGACMFNRKYVMNRVEQAKSQKVPMTNYGIAIAYLSGILDQITLA